MNNLPNVNTIPAVTAANWLARIHALPVTRRMRIMNVCGGHERSISLAGLRSVLPDWLELIPGPGCPVCVCPEEDIYRAIRLALDERVRLLAFGDLLRVPVNVPRSEPRSLEAARAAGADIRPVASPMEVLAQALAEPEIPMVFFAAGFETTMAPVAALIAQGLPPNLSILLSGRLTWPAVALLLDSGQPGFDALIAPGHVATIMGADEWRFVPEQHGLPAAVAGFEAESLLAAIYSTLRQQLEGRVFLDNCYGEVARSAGNPRAKTLLQQVFQVVDSVWRGIGTLPRSGFALQDSLAHQDARQRYPIPEKERKRAGEMPPGCGCAEVVLGRIYPNQCPLYGKACRPESPVGPCMVSDEGACRIWWSSGMRESPSPSSSVTTEISTAHGRIVQ